MTSDNKLTLERYCVILLAISLFVSLFANGAFDCSYEERKASVVFPYMFKEKPPASLDRD